GDGRIHHRTRSAPNEQFGSLCSLFVHLEQRTFFSRRRTEQEKFAAMNNERRPDAVEQLAQVHFEGRVRPDKGGFVHNSENRCAPARSARIGGKRNEVNSVRKTDFAIGCGVVLDELGKLGGRPQFLTDLVKSALSQRWRKEQDREPLARR